MHVTFILRRSKPTEDKHRLHCEDSFQIWQFGLNDAVVHQDMTDLAFFLCFVAELVSSEALVFFDSCFFFPKGNVCSRYTS
jgi:hypothetical protein